MRLRPGLRTMAVALLLAVPALPVWPAQAFVTKPSASAARPAQAHQHTVQLRPPIRYGGSGGQGLRPAIGANAAVPNGYIPCDVYGAYGMGTPSGTAGSGVLIAIVDAFDQPNIQSDLLAFDATLGLPDPPSFNVYRPWGVATPAPTGWSDEISLDVEWAHAMAPGASIALVEAHDNGLTLPAPPPPGTAGQLTAAIWYAVTVLNADIVSMSFGGPEGQFTPADIANLNAFTPQINHAGRMVSYLAATGDNGYGPMNGLVGGPFAPQWPALAPGVVGVGGTSVAPAGFGYISNPGSHTICAPPGTPGVNSSNETVWGNGRCFIDARFFRGSFCVGTGGGPSNFVGKPAWQSISPATTRSTPDVAMLADPATGVAWLNSTTNGVAAPWGSSPIGGTSLATPLWAGVVALLDQARRAVNMPGLGVTPTWSWVYSASAGDFNDITGGFSPGYLNDPCNGSPPATSCAAQPGYDEVTGRGSPKSLSLLTADLVQPANTHAFFTRYDNASAGVGADNLHLVNPSGSRVFGSAALGGGSSLIDFVIDPNSESFVAFPPGTAGGPVDIRSTSRVIASQRVQFNQSFSEVPAQTSASADTHLFVTWYDHISDAGFLNGRDDILVFNPGAGTANVQVHVPGFPACDLPGSIGSGAEQSFTCPSGFGGPATITSDVPVLGSTRVIYFGTFNEVIAQPAAGAQLVSYFTWYDHASSVGFINDNVHVVNSSSFAAHVHADVVGCTPADQTIQPGAFGIFGCPFGQGFGGPVKITSDQPVLSSQRVQYFQSFNEVNSMAPGGAAKTLYMPWYDHASSVGFQNDNVHVINPSSITTVNVTVTIPGCSPAPQTIPAGTFGIFGCPFGSGFGGPVVIQSDGAVLASQRVQFFQSFNEAAAQP